jgi:hypothetical protein
LQTSENKYQVLLVILALAAVLPACGATPAGTDANTFIERAPSATPPAHVSPIAHGEPTHPTPRSATPPADFALIFDSSPCGIGRLDTFRGTYTQGPLWDPPETIPLRLSRAELGGIYATMGEIDLFSYPDGYEVPVPPDGTSTMMVPAPNYYLKVRMGGRTNALSWHDEITDPNPPEARRLRRLMRLLENTIRSRSEVKALPETARGCL